MSKNPHKFLLPLSLNSNLNKLKRIDEKGYAYYLEFKSNYYKLEKYVNLLVNAKCSTFLAKNSENDNIFGRNYDFKHIKFNKKSKNKEDETALLIVLKGLNKKAKYKSLSIIDAFWLDFEKGRYIEGCLDDGKTDITRVAMSPYVVMDGINEKGLSVSIMHLPCENDWQEIDYISEKDLTPEQKEIAIILKNKKDLPNRYDYKVKNGAICINTALKKAWKANKNLSTCQNNPNKKTILHPVLMRKMLDFTSSVDEAIKLAESYNVKSPLPDNDYHIMLADTTGKSVILEWINNKLVILDEKYGTNFYKGRKDRFGYGHDRDEIIKKEFDKTKGILEENKAMNLLKATSQVSTQWSAVYNLDKKTLKLSIMGDYSKIYDFKL